jgi:CheY-like chemotaxis protein
MNLRTHAAAWCDGRVSLQRVLAGVRLLIVDDNADALEAVCAFLKLHGGEVECVASAKEALDGLARFDPHVLLLDLTMPGMDGFELMRRIRRGDHAATPAIAYSGLSDLSDRERAFAAGFQRYLTKPLDPQRLVDTILTLARTSAAAVKPAPRSAIERASIWSTRLPSLAGLRVVLVDDDRDTLDIVSVILMRAGAEVHTFDSVVPAFAGLTASRPHVVLTDVAMPEADGTELLRRIRSRPPGDFGEVPVIALTAYGREYRGAGFDAVLTKPPEPELLVNLVYAAVRPVEVVLYISENEESVHATESLDRLLQRFDPASVLCSVVNVKSAEEQARADHVSVTPALVRHHPRPVARLMGDLQDVDTAAAVLEAWGARELRR